MTYSFFNTLIGFSLDKLQPSLSFTVITLPPRWCPASRFTCAGRVGCEVVRRDKMASSFQEISRKGKYT